MNEAKLVSSEVCQKCAKCCKEFIFSCDFNCALRFLWMDERKIKSKDTSFRLPYNQGMEKNVKFKFPCTQLEEKSGIYKCKVWNETRPNFCNTYPDHLFYDVEVWNQEKIKKILEVESENCPALKKVCVAEVIQMLEERK